MPPEDLADFSKDYVLSNWLWDVKGLGACTQAIQLTDLPCMVRLLGVGQLQSAKVSRDKQA